MTSNLDTRPIELDTLSKRELRIVGRFRCPVEGDTLLAAVAQGTRPWAVIIDLSDFMTVRDSLVQIDSIEALEWRPCNKALR